MRLWLFLNFFFLSLICLLFSLCFFLFWIHLHFEILIFFIFIFIFLLFLYFFIWLSFWLRLRLWIWQVFILCRLILLRWFFFNSAALWFLLLFLLISLWEIFLEISILLELIREGDARFDIKVCWDNTIFLSDAIIRIIHISWLIRL